MKVHYFNQEIADQDDFNLKLAIEQGYVPSTCLLGGIVIMDEIGLGNDPCSGCNGPRLICQGRPMTKTLG